MSAFDTLAEFVRVNMVFQRNKVSLEKKLLELFYALQPYYIEGLLSLLEGYPTRLCVTPS